MTAASAQYDFDSGLMRAPQGSAILFRKLDFGVEQGAIDVDGDEPNWARHI